MGDNFTQYIVEINKQLGGLAEIVKRHDEYTFPEIQNTLKRIESKHNQDYLQYIESKEALNKRLLPLEEDYKKRQEVKKEVKKNSGNILWDLIKMGVMGLVGYLVAIFK